MDDAERQPRRHEDCKTQKDNGQHRVAAHEGSRSLRDEITARLYPSRPIRLPYPPVESALAAAADLLAAVLVAAVFFARLARGAAGAA